MKTLEFLILLALAPAAFSASVDADIEGIRASRSLPSLAIIAVRDGKTLASCAVGVRKLGSPEPVTTDDHWHIGSCTKSMTATLAAILVEQGKLKWTTTVGETFPEWRGSMLPEWQAITLEQLLMHRAGAPGDAPPDLWAEACKRKGAAIDQRLAFVHGLVTRAPEAPAGAKFIYSNQGYAIAGAMLERIAKRPWEQLIRELLFDPLGMKSAGFGAPASFGTVDQPWGHARQGDDVTPVSPGPNSDNPPAIAPAGTVHCSLADLAAYCLIHARGEHDGWQNLKPEDFAKLHAPFPGGEYAMGWGVVPLDWAGGVALNHSGSNTMFYTDIWIAPAKNAVFISATNVGGDPAEKGCDEAIAALVRRFSK